MLIDTGQKCLPQQGPSLLGGSGLSGQPNSSLDHGLFFWPDNPEQLGWPEC